LKIAFVCGPYRDAGGPFYVEQNIWFAREMAATLWAMGYAVICPHLNTAHFSGLVPEEQFLQGAKEILRRCDLVVTVVGWQGSLGCMDEIKLAGSLGIPVYEGINGVPVLALDRTN
jgi:hypothetical protein